MAVKKKVRKGGKHRFLKTLGIGAGVFAAAFAAGSEYTYRKAFYCKPSDEDRDYHILTGEQYDRFREQNIAQITRLKSRPFEEVRITSFDGLQLYGRWYFQDKNAPSAVLMHGWHGTAIRDFCGGANELLDMGFNVMLPDQRGHGKSGGGSLSFGIFERYDCRDWAHFVSDKLQAAVPDPAGGGIRKPPLYLYGISMGAATVLMASSLDLPANTKGIVADCPYSSPADIIVKVASDMNIPALVSYKMASFAASCRAGFDLDETTAAIEAAKSDLPMLIIHGGDDRFVPCVMSEEIAAAAKNCRREVFPGAGHGVSYRTDRDRYVKLIKDFTEETSGGWRW